MTLHLSTEGIEIEVSDTPVRDELAELRAFVVKRHKKNWGAMPDIDPCGDRRYSFAESRQEEDLMFLSEIDRLIALRGE